MKKVAKKPRKPRERRVQLVKPVTLRSILDQIDEVLVKGDEVAQGLWAVMTALRGPDDETATSNLKSDLTIPVRRAAFPKTAALTWTNLGASFGWDGCIWNPATAPEGHFGNHARKAAKALGLGQEPEL